MIGGIYLGSLLIVLGCLVASGIIGISSFGRLASRRRWQYSVGEGKWRYRDNGDHRELSKETRWFLGAFLLVMGIFVIVASIVAG